ncbi:MAG: VOC family protein [Chloroflexi bacterium]|nr:VOC family protein [Chloroflexota bacterium]
MTSTAKVALPPVSQIGIVVRDIAQTAAYYTSTLGIGPFSIIDVKMDNAILRGKPVAYKFKVGFARSGTTEIELIQPVEGENVYAEFLASGREGLHHLGFQVDDFDGMLAAFAAAGIAPVLHSKTRVFGFAYMDTEKVGGVMVELLWQKKR